MYTEMCECPEEYSESCACYDAHADLDNKTDDNEGFSWHEAPEALLFARHYYHCRMVASVVSSTASSLLPGHFSCYQEIGYF